MTDTSGERGLLWSPKRAESALADEITRPKLEAFMMN
jgi:hypothetical protein